MIKNIAIRGQGEGQKIITLLENLGGTNFYSLTGNSENTYYYIKSDGKIWYIFFDDMLLDEWQLYTYDSFKEKYPFIVGNMVTVQGWRDPGYVISSYIKESQVFYDIVFNDKHKSMARGVCVECIKFYNHPNNNILTIKENMKNNIEFDLSKYSYEVKDGKLIIEEKKPVYPKTIEECVKLLGVDFRLDMDSYKRKLMANFYRLILCRDAYWKIAGEEMELGKPWEPEWNHINRRFYCIYNFKSNIVKNVIYTENKILAFPTEKMRDAFYENFKDLIEQCKELL